MKHCSLACDRSHYARGFCAYHYNLDRKRNTTKICELDKCSEPALSQGLCSKHYQRDLKHGDPQITLRAENGQGTNQKGYVRVRVDGKKVMAHRLVIEEAIGRPLLASEKIHHVNGDKADNRLTNLELWSTSQPPGQRVEDKAIWAREILALYGDEFEMQRYGKEETWESVF